MRFINANRAGTYLSGSPRWWYWPRDSARSDFSLGLQPAPPCLDDAHTINGDDDRHCCRLFCRALPHCKRNRANGCIIASVFGGSRGRKADYRFAP